MPTSFSPLCAERLLSFAVGLASSARLFTAEQLARHPDLSWYRDPALRAREFLAKYPEVFETIPGPYREPMRRRLTTQAKRKYGLHFKSINGISQRSYHWLGIADIWIEMTFNGGRPTEWRTEWDGQFDVYCVWCGVPYLIEYQRSPITQNQWKAKWKKRLKWYGEQKWTIKPKVVLVNVTGQLEETISAPRGTVMCGDINELHRVLMPPR